MILEFILEFNHDSSFRRKKIEDVSWNCSLAKHVMESLHYTIYTVALPINLNRLLCNQMVHKLFELQNNIEKF